MLLSSCVKVTPEGSPPAMASQAGVNQGWKQTVGCMVSPVANSHSHQGQEGNQSINQPRPLGKRALSRLSLSLRPSQAGRTTPTPGGEARRGKASKSTHMSGDFGVRLGFNPGKRSKRNGGEAGSPAESAPPRPAAQLHPHARPGGPRHA